MSDPLSREALAELEAAVLALLPASVKAVRTLPTRITPAGLGGFIATNRDPEEDILGRRVTGQVVVTVRAPTLKDLQDTEDDAIRALLTAGRSELMSRGLHHIALDGVGEERAASSGPKGSGTERDIRFDVRFEFLKTSTAADGVILEIPLDLEVTEDPGGP